MKKRGFGVLASALILFSAAGICLPARASASTFSLEVWGWIDGRDRLAVSGNTLQWYHFDYDWPGINGGHHDAVSVSTSADGVPAQDLDWWVDSSNTTLTITPGVPATDNFTLTALEARYSLWTVQAPDAGNSYTTVIEFNDNSPGGAAWYGARLDYEYTASTPVPPGTSVPAPAAAWLLVAGLAGLAAVRRRIKK